MTWQVGALALGVAGSVAPLRRVPPALVTALVATVAVVVGIVPLDVVGDTARALDGPLAFLLLAVPLAVALDSMGFFAGVAASFDGGDRLRLGLWCLAAGVTVTCNLDAAVVLLTPLYVRIARRRGEDPVALGFIPALLASLASSVLPVSNLTNLVVADHFGLSATDFLTRAAPAAVAATIVGWLAYRRVFPRAPRGSIVVDDAVDGRALRRGGVVVAVLLVGFTLGDRLGVPAWTVAAVALVLAVAVSGFLPWRATPIRPAVLAFGLGVLALGAADSIDLARVTGIEGSVGDLATFATAVAGSNVINNLPMTLVFLDPLTQHPDRVWAVVLGVNLGPTLWTMGALSTLLWQSTMASLGSPVSARRYASVGARVGLPGLAVAAAWLALI